MRGLNNRQARFVDEYLIDLNATQAAIRAGYKAKTAAVMASKMLRNAHIAAEVAKRQEKRSKRTEITQDRVLLELARIAFADVRKVARWDRGDVSLIESSELTDDEACAISEVGNTREGVKVKMHDKLRALEMLGRHLGTFKEGGGDDEDLPMPTRIDIRVVDASVPRD